MLVGLLASGGLAGRKDGVKDGDNVGGGSTARSTGDVVGVDVLGALKGDKVVGCVVVGCLVVGCVLDSCVVVGCAVGTTAASPSVGEAVALVEMAPLTAILKVPTVAKPETPVTRMLYFIPETVVKVRAESLPLALLLAMQASKLHSPEKATKFVLKEAPITCTSTVPSSPINVYQIPLDWEFTEQVWTLKSAKAPVVSPTPEKGLVATRVAVSQLSLEGRSSS